MFQSELKEGQRERERDCEGKIRKATKRWGKEMTKVQSGNVEEQKAGDVSKNERA